MLIVDDDLYIAKIMRSILESFEVAQVRMSATYDDACGILNSGKFDCIFIDNMTRKKNGLKLAEYIRHSEKADLKTVPIILYTAFTGLQSIIKARDAGVTEVLTKPVSPEQIMKKMTNALFNQREFIDTDIYSGPDRRRRIRDHDGTDERRKTEIPLPAENEKTTNDQTGDA